jgi:hypothetical protein
LEQCTRVTRLGADRRPEPRLDRAPIAPVKSLCW